MTTSIAVSFVVIFIIAAVSFSYACVYHSDLKEYEAIIESSMENNNMLIRKCEELMKQNEELSNKCNKLDVDTNDLIATGLQQNDLIKSVIRDNAELTAKVNEILMHMDDGK